MTEGKELADMTTSEVRKHTTRWASDVDLQKGLLKAKMVDQGNGKRSVISLTIKVERSLSGDWLYRPRMSVIPNSELEMHIEDQKAEYQRIFNSSVGTPASEDSYRKHEMELSLEFARDRGDKDWEDSYEQVGSQKY